MLKHVKESSQSSNKELVTFWHILKEGWRLFPEPRQEWGGLAPDFVGDSVKILEDEINRRLMSGKLTQKIIASILDPTAQQKRASREMGRIIEKAKKTRRRADGAFS